MLIALIGPRTTALAAAPTPLPPLIDMTGAPATFV